MKKRWQTKIAIYVVTYPYAPLVELWGLKPGWLLYYIFRIYHLKDPKQWKSLDWSPVSSFIIYLESIILISYTFWWSLAQTHQLFSKIRSTSSTWDIKILLFPIISRRIDYAYDILLFFRYPYTSDKVLLSDRIAREVVQPPEARSNILLLPFC